MQEKLLKKLAAITCLAVLVVVIMAIRGYPSTWETIAQSAVQVSFGLIISMVVMGDFCIITIVYGKLIDRAALRTRIALWLHRLMAKLRAKNSASIYPWLQNFLFTVLTKYNDQLQLPVGADMGCLTPDGRKIVFRKGSVFYAFQLLVNDLPDMDADKLKLLLNQRIHAELCNYGIPGLHTSFSYAGAVFDSVYVDRMIYDAERSIINLELLFVVCPQDAENIKAALIRDMPKSAPVVTVYDDER